MDYAMGVVVLTGANDFMRRSALKSLTEEFVRRYGDFGLESIDASETEFGRLLESVAAHPFLAPRRMILLLGIGANKPLADNPDQLLEAVAETTDLVIDERKFDKRLNLYKILKKKADFQEFAELDERALSKWLIEEAKSRGGSISAADAGYLVNRIGPDQMGLNQELDKLLTYDETITRQTIDLLTEPLPRSSVFDLLDAAFAGEHKRTIDLYQDQRKQQVEPQAIMAMIAWQLHVLAVVKFNEKESPEIIAKSAKLNPYVVRKTLSLTRRLTQTEVKDMLGRALALDIRLKSEMIDADDAVQHFLLTI